MEVERKRILVVEDDRGRAELVRRFAEKYGYECEVLAEDVVQHILKNLEARVLEFEPDIAVVDGLKGKCFDAIEIIKNTKPDTFCVVYTSVGRDDGKELEGRGYNVVYNKDYSALFDLLNSGFGV